MENTVVEVEHALYILPKETMERLEDNWEHLYILSRWMYSVGKDIIFDSRYSILDKYMKEMKLLPEYTARTWSEDDCPVELLKSYNLDDSIETVVTFKDSCSIPSITTWDDLRLEYGYLKTKRRISFKKDGFNFHISYMDGVIYKGNTRARKGNGLEFKDLSELNVPKNISLKGNINIIGELTLSKENFKKLKTMYPLLQLMSSRAAVRTALANKEAMHLLKFTAFNVQELDDMLEEERLLKEWGFTDPQYEWVSSWEELVYKIKEYSERAKTFEDPTDGIVIEDLTKDVQRAIRLGFWEESILRSYVISYEEESGNFNDIPKLLIRRVVTEKSAHTLIPITNWGRIIKFNLLPGSPIAFKLTSDSAPVIDLVATKLLQNQYACRYDLYKEMIDLEEASKFM